MHINCDLKEEDVHVRIYGKFFAHNTKLNYKALKGKAFWITTGPWMPGRDDGLMTACMAFSWIASRNNTRRAVQIHLNILMLLDCFNQSKAQKKASKKWFNPCNNNWHLSVIHTSTFNSPNFHKKKLSSTTICLTELFEQLLDLGGFSRSLSVWSGQCGVFFWKNPCGKCWVWSPLPRMQSWQIQSVYI